MDYYSILGVPRNASPEQIKKAYKKASMQHHPDRGGNQDEFVKVQQAYEILSNSDKRSAYDNPQPQGFGPNGFRGNTSAKNFNDMFANMFGQGFAQQQTPRNRDITVQADISLKDVITGKNLIIQYQLQTGELETVTVDVPAGAKHGDTIQYEALGDKGHPNYPRGNLNVRIKVSKNRHWHRDNDNLFTKSLVNIFDLLLGCVIIITTLDGKRLEIKVPQGTKPGAKFSIPGYGLPSMHTRQRGILFVEIDTEMPTITNELVLNRIQQLKDDIN